MEIIITGSAFDTGISIKKHIHEKLENVSKKLKSGKVHKIHAVLNKEGINFLCRIDIIEEIGGSPIIHASHEATDAYPCVDFAIKKVEEQIIKQKEKIIHDRNHFGLEAKEKSRNLPEETPDQVFAEIDETVDEEALIEDEKKIL